jgi:hypothetical protein
MGEKRMVEILNQQGERIATIHDSEAFAQLLDEFERFFERYGDLYFPVTRFISNVNFIVNEGMIYDAKDAAENLERIRRQFGDTRDNLYPSEFHEA